MTTFDTDIYVRGRLRCDQLDVPNDSITNENFDANNPLEAVKQEHQYRVNVRQNHGGAVVARRETVHVAYSDGDVVGVRMQVSVAAIGDSEVTIDVLKNGVSILTAPKVIDNALTAYTTDVAGIASAPYVEDDNFEIQVTVAAGTGTLPQGLFVELVLREAAGV